MTMMSDLSQDLVEEILSRVPITSLGAVRSTCKQWNSFSKDRILCKGETRQEFLGFMMKGFNVCSMRFDLHGIPNEDVGLVQTSIKQIAKFSQVQMFQIFHCGGLLLLVTEEAYKRLIVWNPYMGQTRWIQPKTNQYCRNTYALGYDNNRDHKILRIMEKNHEIYDFKSNSWRVLDIIPHWKIKVYSEYVPWEIKHYQNYVSLKGNTYFFARGEKTGQGPTVIKENKDCLLCFDFTRERFGPCLPLPFHFATYDSTTLSSIREEQLAVLSKNRDTSEMEIWVTTKIEPDAVSWSNFLTVDITRFKFYIVSFSIDQEKKLAVLFDINRLKETIRYIACIIGESGYLRIVDLGEGRFIAHYLCSLLLQV